MLARKCANSARPLEYVLYGTTQTNRSTNVPRNEPEKSFHQPGNQQRNETHVHEGTPQQKHSDNHADTQTQPKTCRSHTNQNIAQHAHTMSSISVVNWSILTLGVKNWHLDRATLTHGVKMPSWTRATLTLEVKIDVWTRRH